MTIKQGTFEQRVRHVLSVFLCPYLNTRNKYNTAVFEPKAKKGGLPGPLH